MAKFQNGQNVFVNIEGTWRKAQVYGYDSSSKRSHPYLVGIDGFSKGHDGRKQKTSYFKGTLPSSGSKHSLWFSEGAMREEDPTPKGYSSPSIDVGEDLYLVVLKNLGK